VMLFPPPLAAEVERALVLVKGKLPAEFLMFWGHTNGANLFVNDSGMHGVGVTSTELLEELQREERERYGSALNGYVIFARVNGSGDFLAFDEAGRVVDGIHAEQPSEWRVIAGSFGEWLQRLVDAEGGYYWLEELYNAARLDATESPS
jgi:hypothetical protein